MKPCQIYIHFHWIIHNLEKVLWSLQYYSSVNTLLAVIGKNSNFEKLESIIEKAPISIKIETNRFILHAFDKVSNDWKIPLPETSIQMLKRTINIATELIDEKELVNELYENLLIRGRLFYILGDDDNAISDFSRAITIDPENSLGWSNRAIVFVLSKFYEAASSDIKKAISLDPESKKYKLILQQIQELMKS